MRNKQGNIRKKMYQGKQEKDRHRGTLMAGAADVRGNCETSDEYDAPDTILST